MSQYVDQSQLGRELGAVDLIFSELLAKNYYRKQFFDFATTDKNDITCLNRRLSYQKTVFGSMVVMNDHYEIPSICLIPSQFIGVLE